MSDKPSPIAKGTFALSMIARSLDGLRQQARFWAQARVIAARHRAQTAETVSALKKKYEGPISGKMRVWDLIGRLSECVDPSDFSLYCTSQLTHVLQVLEAMERDGVKDPDMLLVALVHDLGKLLLLEREDPENVVCMNTPIGEYPTGVGLDKVVFQWNHDEFAYSRLAGSVPDHVAWTVRYHSVMLDRVRPLMDARDRDYAARYLEPFQKYDQGSKSAYSIPRASLEDYRDMIEGWFPQPISF